MERLKITGLEWAVMAITLLVVAVMAAYFWGSTGNAQIDKIIKKYLGGISIGPGIGSGNGGYGGSYGGQDTRIYYTVALQYKPELLAAELNRKGLDYSLLVEKVEVSE